MHADDGVEFLLGHLMEQAVPQIAGVVDHHVDAPERVDCRLHHPLRAVPRRDAVAVRNRAPAPGEDLFRDFVRDRALGGRATEADAEIVDDDGRSRLGEIQRYAASDAATGASDQRDFSFHHAHVVPQ